MNHITRIRTPHANLIVPRRHAESAVALAHPHDAWTWTIVALALCAAVLLAGYVMQANMMAAQTWRMQDAQNRLTQLRQERDALVARQAGLDDRAVLQELAQRQGMVPAGTVVYLVQDDAVAAR